VGGRHFHLAHPGGDVANFAGKLPGVDLRGDGGYAVLPPSVHKSGAAYRWEGDSEGSPLAAVPDWLVDLLRLPSGERSARPPLDLATILDGIPYHQRDDTLYRFAREMLSDGVPIKYADLLVRQAARLAEVGDDGPFDEEVAAEKVARVYAEGKAPPRARGAKAPRPASAASIAATWPTSRHSSPARTCKTATSWPCSG
jgi:hypothetical protein